MDRCIPCPAASTLLRLCAATAGAIVLAAFTISCAFAQTLTDPTPPAKWSPPQAAAKSKSTSAANLKSCGTYGAGFVNVPGTDACVKVGGWVSVEGAAGR